jgi:hypothetical protein
MGLVTEGTLRGLKGETDVRGVEVLEGGPVELKFLIGELASSLQTGEAGGDLEAAGVVGALIRRAVIGVLIFGLVS